MQYAHSQYGSFIPHPNMAIPSNGYLADRQLACLVVMHHLGKHLAESSMQQYSANILNYGCSMWEKIVPMCTIHLAVAAMCKETGVEELRLPCRTSLI